MMIMLKAIKISTAKITTLIVLILSFCSSVAAQEKFTATVNKNKVVVGERIQVTFKIIGDGDSFEPPSFSHFRVLSGPNKSSSMSWVNGRSSSSTSYSYILSPEKEGTYTIGAGKLIHKNTTYETQPVTIEVSKSNTPNTNTGTADNSNDLSKYVFLKCYTSKSSAVVGEQIVATYKLYYNVNLGNVNVKEVPSFDGFWSELIEIDPTKNRGTEVINGVSYNVATIHKSVISPQRSGDLRADALVLDLVVQVQDKSRGRSIFDQFLGRYKNVEYEAKSTTRKIKVAPIPSAGKPADFSGAVGKFNFKASIDKDNVKSDEAINLKLSINGNGNLQLFDPPKVTFPADFEVYDPKINDRISVTENGVVGKKEYEYLIIPRHGGDFEIPPISFSYFDINQKKYVTQQSDPFIIHVEKGENENATVSRFSGTNQSEVNIIGNDIRYINTSETSVTEIGTSFFGSRLFYGLLGTPFILLIGFITFYNKLAAYNSNTTLVKERKASKVAKKRLSKAKQHLDDNNTSAFNEEIFKAIYGYLSDKLTIDVASLSKENIMASLISKSVDQQTVETLIATLDNCEMARFAPSSSLPASEVYQNTANVIGKIEEAL